MKLKKLKKDIRRSIPQLKYQKWELLEYGERLIRCYAPLKPNQNIHQTAFAGSLSSLMIICGWLQVYQWVERYYPGSTVVMQKADVNYLKPVKEDIYIQSISPERSEWNKLNESILEKAKGKITVEVFIGQEKNVFATLKGKYHISLNKKKG